MVVVAVAVMMMAAGGIEENEDVREGRVV